MPKFNVQFEASAGWLANFKHRFGLLFSKEKKLNDEADAVASSSIDLESLGKDEVLKFLAATIAPERPPVTPQEAREAFQTLNRYVQMNSGIKLILM